MDKEEIIDFIDKNTEIEVYYKYLIGQEVWYFINNGNDFSSSYDDFKKLISLKLEIPFNNISIIGSAKTRYSFSPKKNFKEFNSNSDFDLIIVSKEAYDNMWSAYREIYQQSRLPNYYKKCSDIFNGFLSVKDSDPTFGNGVLEEWQRKVRTFKADIQLKFNILHEVNYRIYSDWESVQDYHVRGISRLKGKISETN